MLRKVNPIIVIQTFLESSGFLRFLYPRAKITIKTNNFMPTFVWLRLSSGLTESCSPTRTIPARRAVSPACNTPGLIVRGLLFH